MIAMIEAVRTNVSPAGVWAVVVVAVACLAFWLVALAVASRYPGVHHRRTPGMPGPVLGGTHVSDCGRSVAPSRASAAMFDADEADAMAAAGAASEGSPVAAPHPVPVPSQRVPGAAPAPSQPTPGQPVLTQPSPGQRAPGQPDAPVMPAQRSGDADRPQHTAAGTNRVGHNRG